MLKQLFTFALRSFRKARLINSLNVAGLTLGLSVFFLVSLFVYQEGSYEHDFSKRDRIYQIGTDFFDMGKMAKTSPNLPHVLADIPEIESHTLLYNVEKAKIFHDGSDYEERRVIRADSAFFDIFEFELLSGDVHTILNEPDRVVINEEVALEMFGTTDVVGQELKVGTYQFNYEVKTITGVSKSPKFKTQLDYDILVSDLRTKTIEPNDWGTLGYYVYAVLQEGIDKAQLDAKLVALNKQFLYPKYAEESGATYDEWVASEEYIGFFAESLDELRYESEAGYAMMPKADKNRTNTLSIVGLVALIISIINFVNIATARASLRMKEVALKRIMGSSRKWLIAQFMLEAFMLISLSAILALGLVETIIIWQPMSFQGFVEYSVLQSSQWIMAVMLFTIGLTLFSGLYPALYLSSGNVVTILKNGLSKGSFNIFNAALLRKGATVLQFICSIGLIGAVITMFLQINYLRERDLGYEANDVLVIGNIHDLGDKVDVFRKELLKVPVVASSSYANDLPIEKNEWHVPNEVTDESGKTYLITFLGVEDSFFETLDLELIAGDGFGPRENKEPLLQGGTISSAQGAQQRVILNEAAVQTLNLKNPIGVVFNDQLIVGVVENFLFSDLTMATEPMILTQMRPRDLSPFYFNPLFIELSPYSSETRGAVEALWGSLTDKRIKSFPMKATYDRLIKVENASFNAVLIFSIFAVFVSCIGLFGLAVFTVDQRVREFGIRKVMGASVQDIIRLFSWDFLKLVLLAFLLAMPIAMYVLNLWLEGFANRINLSYSMVLLTGLSAALIAIVTVLFQSVKAGRLNPVDTLRSE